MFAVIETKGATHITIHVPSEGAEKSLPALANMLEQNATFIMQNWSGVDVVKPVMSIILGDKFVTEHAGQEIVVAENDHTLDDSFVLATPDVFTSNAKAIKAKDEELQRLRNELIFVRGELESTRMQLKAMVENVVE